MTQGAKWSIAGALIGASFALLSQAPAAWLANVISHASQQRFVLQNAQGTVWRGSAIALLTNGSQGSQAPVAKGTPLPTRVHWNFSPGFDSQLMRFVMRAHISSACCTIEPLQLTMSFGWQGMRIDLANQKSQWPRQKKSCKKCGTMIPTG